MASEMRNVGLSIYFRAWQIALQQGYRSKITSARLTRVDSNIYSLGEAAYPFVFIDDNLDPWTDVVVKQGSMIIDPSEYEVDYLKSEIHFPDGATGNFDVDASHFTLNVLQSYPEDEELKAINLPMVACDNYDSMGRTFAIGTAELFRNRTGMVSILARNLGELEDLMDTYERFIAHVNLANFAAAQPLSADNQLNLSYRFADQFVRRLEQRVKPYAKKVAYDPQRSSEKERYKAQVTFETETVS